MRILVIAIALAFGSMAAGPTPLGEAVAAKAKKGKKGKKGKKASKGAESALPDGRALSERVIELTRVQLLEEKTNYVMKGRFEMPAQGITGTLLIVAQAPDTTWTLVSIPGIGEMLEGFDGTHAWSLDPVQGPRIKSAEETAHSRWSADFDGASNLTRFTEIVTEGQVEFAGEPAWRVRMERQDLPPRWYYLSVDTGLELGVESTSTTAMGDMTSVVRFEEYVEMEGMLMPRRMTTEASGMTQVIVVESFETDVAELPSTAMPPEVAELLEE